MATGILQTKGSQIITPDGQPIQLRGNCVGSWMNMENFINGYPGAEHALRAVMREVLEAGKARFFFDLWESVKVSTAILLSDRYNRTYKSKRIPLEKITPCCSTRYCLRSQKSPSSSSRTSKGASALGPSRRPIA